MKASSKATLLSALIFPGLGHLYLKKARRGLAIMLVVLSTLSFVVWSVVEGALGNIDRIMAQAGGGAPDLQNITELVGSQTMITSPYADAVFYLVIGIWIAAAADAYRIGRKKEFRNQESPAE